MDAQDQPFDLGIVLGLVDVFMGTSAARSHSKRTL